MAINIREIAKQAGVSPTTVSFVINNKEGVSEKTREHVKQLLEENGYVVKRIKQKRVSKLSLCIVKYVEDASSRENDNELFSFIIDNLNEASSAMNIRVFMTVCNTENYKEEIVGVLKERYSAVVVIGTTLSIEQMRWLDALDVSDKPLVVVDNFMGCTSVCSVTTADREISHTAVKYLHSLGMRSVGYLQSEAKFSKFSERQFGFREMMRQLGLKDELRIPLRPSLNGAYEGMRNWLSKGSALPEAFYADSSLIALGAMKALQEKGFRIPDDISMIGADNIPYGMLSTPTLTTVSSPYKEISRMALWLIMRRLGENGIHRYAEHICVCGKLMVRGSTRSEK